MNIAEIERRFRGRTPAPLGRHRNYAVMVPLVERPDGLHLLFEVRSEDMDIQPGEVCFPGGRQEDGESAEACALRETCEELGICPDQVRIIAPLDYIQMYSNFTLRPFLAVLDAKALETARINPAEVKETFLVPLSYFFETDPTTITLDVAPVVPADFPYDLINAPGGYNWRKGQNVVPIYRFQDWTIWGLTARIVGHLVDVARAD